MILLDIIVMHVNKDVKTAKDYIEKVYGNKNFTRSIELKDEQSLIDLIQDYGNYLVEESKRKNNNF